MQRININQALSTGLFCIHMHSLFHSVTDMSGNTKKHDNHKDTLNMSIKTNQARDVLGIGSLDVLGIGMLMFIYARRTETVEQMGTSGLG